MNKTKQVAENSSEILTVHGLTVHGLSSTRFYSVWGNMKSRCHNPNSSSYKYYGGRRIKVCDRWQIFTNFKDDMYESYLKHAEEHGEGNTSIDRMNNEGNYEPTNCRWTTLDKQSLNRRQRNDNTSGYTGLSWDKTLKKWNAYIHVNDKKVNIGYYVDKEEAIKARRTYEARYYDAIQIDGARYELDLLTSNFYAKGLTIE